MSMEIDSKRARDWASANPILRKGELAFDETSGRLKIGDGKTRWNSLRFISDTQGTPYQLPERLSDAALRAAFVRSNGPAQAAEAHVDFSVKPNGTLDVSDSGQSLRYVATSTQGALAVEGGWLTNTGTAGTSTGYSETQLSGNVSRIGAEFAFDTLTGTDNGAAATLVIWQASRVDTYPSVPAARCHLTVTRTTWTYGIWPSQGAGAQIVLATGGFATALAADGTTKHKVEVVIDGDTAYLQLPDGRTAIIVDSRIRTLAGAFACWEVYRPDASGGVRPKFSRAWASADPSPLIANSVVSRLARFETAATSRPRTVSSSGSTQVDATATSGATATEIDTGMRLSMIVPQSGKIAVRMCAYIGMTGATTYFWQPQVIDPFSGSVLRNPSVQVASAVTNGWVNVDYEHRTLSPGSAVELRWAHWATGASIASVKRDAGTGRQAMYQATAAI
jgi:hypothetical protein